MPYADKEHKKKKDRQYGREHKERYNDWYVSVKSMFSCSVCGEDDPVRLEFHHRDPTNKVKAVSELARNRADKEVVLAEIEKCDVLCANCHRKLHFWKGR